MEFDHTKAFEKEIVPILLELTKALIKHKINGFCHFDIAYADTDLHCFSQTWETDSVHMTEMIDVLDMIANDDQCFAAASKAIEEVPDEYQQTQYLQ